MMQEPNKERELLTALNSAYMKLAKYMPGTCSQISFHEAKRDFDNFHKAEDEYFQFLRGSSGKTE